MHFKSLVIASLLAALTSFVQAAPVSLPSGEVPSPSERIFALGKDRIIRAACCKTCRKGKACGNSCISREKNCHKGVGCACDG
ncbi:hypothetical protein [Roseovarius sp. THAF27]|uniref:hypothetical protein n=1 Tax=Roseovarius sp. THAF27 TaxID=2587850 RepID=UPI00126803B5|nr:hypothetical protein [Roseovarius sp. THAF27]